MPVSETPAPVRPAPAPQGSAPGGRRLPLRYALPLAAAAGAGFYAAFPPLNLWPLAPVAVAGLTVAVEGQRARAAAGVGLAFSAVFFGLLVRWLAGSIGVLPWLALTLAETLILAAMTAPLPMLLSLRGLRGLRVPVVAVWWTAGEAVRGRVPLGGFPWGRLAFSQADSPLLAWARVAGAPAVTFATALVGGALAAAVMGAGARDRLQGVGWLVAVAAGTAAVPTPESGSADRHGDIALVQGNAPRERTLAEQARVRNVAANHAQATLRLAARINAGRLPRPDVVIWPENATDADPSTDLYLGGLVRASVDSVGRPILVGAILDGAGGRTYNAGQLWFPGGGPGPWYAKRHLVPFGEYIPARGVLGGFGDLQLIPRDFTPGTRTAVLTAGRVRIGDVICYEIGFDGLVRSGVRAGANLLVEQTNDATFIRDGDNAETEQQLAMARLRAVEHDRTVAVASTTGISAVIRPDGSLAARTGVWTQQVLTARVPLHTAITPADRLGAWPEAAGTAAAVALMGYAAWRRRCPAGRTVR